MRPAERPLARDTTRTRRQRWSQSHRERRATQLAGGAPMCRGRGKGGKTTARSSSVTSPGQRPLFGPYWRRVVSVRGIVTSVCLFRQTESQPDEISQDIFDQALRCLKRQKRCRCERQPIPEALVVHQGQSANFNKPRSGASYSGLRHRKASETPDARAHGGESRA